ncbi:LmeA family phospholipid-binding protein [Quadrisphaera sp. DSM 44207]|uniref:LmeA family phospholipid-binding protein n=1 Tax=Quadrisphaera sp. DSM 44207 TaxID=1881057 RepID=UPI000890714F|nr:LmeA family phospholipid-binding protein [Quadrisphaera sp. DSM 44207]SDQ08401.1 Protein of unknown function [Quadrisphaera sp. DSM 44207]
MERQRVKDHLVGAGAAVLVLLLAVTVVLWWVSEPVTGGARVPQPRAAAGTDPGQAAGQDASPPTDLADGETWLDDVVLDAGTLATPGSRLRDVRAVGRDVRTGPAGVVAGTLAVDATVPFEVVAASLGDDATVRPAGNSSATVVRTLEFAGRGLTVAATGTVEVVAGEIAFEPDSIDVGGPDVLSEAIAAVARRLVTTSSPVEGLPEGLVLQDVDVRDDGFRAALQGERVRLAP